MKRGILTIPKAFMLSLIIHIVVLGAAVVFGSHLDKKVIEPVVVFLSDVMPGGNEGGGGNKAPDPQIRKAKPLKGEARKHKASPPAPEKAVSMAKNVERTAEPVVSTEPAAANDMSIASSPVEGAAAGTGGTAGGSGGSGGGGFGYGSGGRGGSGGGTGRGHGTGSGDRNILAEQYLAAHYAYIRDLITKHLKYPQIAKKMGWAGKVVVSFLVKENGQVENSRVVASSGYEVLDRNVIAVIGEVQPFPKPPVKAQLIIPITYRLE